MKKIYYLSTCDTCKRIIKEVGIDQGFEFQDIKFEPITSGQIEQMHSYSGSYESLFSRKARKFRAMGLADKDLNEQDYKELILQEYTFLKRPVVIIENEIFIGNSSKNVTLLKERISKN